MKPLRIGLISEELPPETGWGGIGAYVLDLGRGLARLGHRVHVVSRCWGRPTVRDVDGVRVHRVGIPPPSWRRGTWFVNLRFPEARDIGLWNLRVSRVVRRLAATEGLDVVETPEFRAQGLWTRLRLPRVPLVVRLHTPAFLCRRFNEVAVGGSPWDTRASEGAERVLTRLASLVTSPSRSLATEVARAWGLDAASVHVIPNPIDEERFAPGPDGSSAEGGPSVLYVGRLERRKGVETLADAFPAIRRAVPTARLRFVGKDHPSGPGGTSLAAHLRARLRAAGVPDDAVDLHGAVERTDLPAIYRSATVCVVPSLYENFPYTCLEAMASGRAVVGTAAGGIPEIVTDRVDGSLVPPDDPAALAVAVVEVLRDRALRERLGAEARRTVSARFSREAVCGATAAMYAEVRSRRRRRRG